MNARRTGVLAISVIAMIVAVSLFVALIWQGIGLLRGASHLGSQSGRSDLPASASPNPLNATSAQDFYNQTVNWRLCSETEITLDVATPPSDMSPYECATILAPLDWDDPAGEQIELAVAVHRNGKEAAPALFYNLGGPGGNAVKSLSYQIADNLGDALIEAYDIVALDPRGVGASTPVKCMSDAELDEFNTGESLVESDASPQEKIETLIEASVEIAQGCQKYSGDLYKHIDTVSAAKDFDMVRELLDQEKFNYLGYSYGTFLGATYADLFPEKAGRLVLDGAVDPALSVNEVSDLQMRGFEASIRHWVEDCQSGSGCPLTGSVDDGMMTVKKFLERLAVSPLETVDPQRPLTQNLAMGAIVGLMYSEQTYSVLTQAMTQALKDNDGSQLLYLADFLNDRNDDGTYASNSASALIAINNLDYSAQGTPEEWEAEAKKLEEELTVMGQFAGYSSAGINEWPTAHAERQEIRASGTPPIVVVGTTHDPATPYVMSESLARQLEAGVLVTSEGWDHTAYSKTASECVIGAVEGYLVDGTVPEDGLVCQ
ncbi:alpha/beta hydrolase [Schaalia vaccimaxillae]|uniref:alpha/beta hydrolase n=1 Tax=Schaalia vaccimaxillae TaxID=183916 RepID=UPI0003B472D4|nr:alpha/beta hydrolase [Schaalia vaccimaxillae]